MKLDRTEMVIIGLAAVALVALLVAKYKPQSVSILNEPIAETAWGDQNAGPRYLLGAEPWAFQPWLGNSIPQVTSGQGSQQAAFTDFPNFGAG